MNKKIVVVLSVAIFLGLIAVFALRVLLLSSTTNPVANLIEKNVPILGKIVGESTAGEANTTVENVNFEVVSKIPQYQIANTHLDASQLNSYLKDLQLLPLHDKEFQEYSLATNGQIVSQVRKADFKTVRVTFYPASSLPSDYALSTQFKSHHLFDEAAANQLFVAYFAGTPNGNTIDIPVYIDPVASVQFGFTPSEYLTQVYLKALFFNFYDIELPTFRVPQEEFANRIKNTVTPVIPVTSPTSMINVFSVQTIKNVLIPQAFAAGTCGSARCGITVGGIGKCSGSQTTTYSCSGDGSSCPCTGAYSGSCVGHTVTGNSGRICTGSCPAGEGSCTGYSAPTCKSGPPDDVCSQSGSTCYRSDCDCAMGSCGSPTCTWGAWSACSATCGGGTQSRTSSCGVTQTQSCGSTSCCGNGTCSGGESCSTCSSDCGVCAPPPSGPFCGDNSCNNGETCSSCSKDCGACQNSCTPSCTTACGQNNGCGGTCSNSDKGTPGTTANQTPPDSFAVVASNGQATLTWAAVPKADLYEVQVYPTGTTAGQECTAPNHHCPTPSSARTFTFTIDSGVNNYTWRVRAINSSCGSTATGPWTTPITFSFGGSLSGNFYDDSTGVAAINPSTGLCEAASSNLETPPAGSSMTAVWNGTTTAGALNGAFYDVSNIGYDPNTVLTLNLPAGFRCTCPAGCSYSGISVPQGNVHFYITNAPVGWWQSANAYLYAGISSGPAIQSKIPVTCASSGTCTAALSKYDSSSTLNSDSTSLTGGGSIDSTDDTSNTYSYLNESGTNTHAEGMKLNGPKEDYSYFSQLYGITTGSTVDFSGDQPTSAPANGNAYYANSDVTINNPWTLNTADSIVVFVNGNLNVNSPILVAKGGFVSFIVKGNITFTKGLGSNTSNVPTVAGVYVANGLIITESNSPGDDLKFIGEGTFVGWNGVQLLRSFNNANTARGATEPIETFNFRPDFLLTVPEKMTKPLYLWQETN